MSRDAYFLCGLVGVGVVAGVIVCAPSEFWRITVADLLMPAAAVGVGAWINTTLRRRAELDRISVSYMSSLNERIEALVDASVNKTKKEKVLSVLRRLGNEIAWLLAVEVEVQQAHSEQSCRLINEYLELKTSLTDDLRNSPQSLRASREVRLAALRIHWQLCEHLLRRSADYRTKQKPKAPA